MSNARNKHPHPTPYCIVRRARSEECIQRQGQNNFRLGCVCGRGSALRQAYLYAYATHTDIVTKMHVPNDRMKTLSSTRERWRLFLPPIRRSDK
jgi:hypothetical protein